MICKFNKLQIIYVIQVLGYQNVHKIRYMLQWGIYLRFMFGIKLFVSIKIRFHPRLVKLQPTDLSSVL